jgi:hypothetical protein
MIKLKDLLLENKAPDIFVPRRVEDRLDRYIKTFIRTELNNPNAMLDLIDSDLTEIPEIIKDLEIKGSFRCSYNHLTSLKNSPKSVGGDFNCNNNMLTSLTGVTEHIGGNFWCQHNELKSLKGAPKTVGGSFVCYYNPGLFSERQIKRVCKVGGSIWTD